MAQVQGSHLVATIPNKNATFTMPGSTDLVKCEDGVPIQVCGRVLTVSGEHTKTLLSLSRQLANQLTLNSHTSLQLADKFGAQITGDMELVLAIKEGRAPLQASMTIAALREIEQKKCEAESKKEELAQYQWQVLVDEITSVSKQVASLASQLNGVKDDCATIVASARKEDELKYDRLEHKVEHETKIREVNMKDFDLKLEKIVQAICAERSARDVANHNLDSQLSQFDSKIEADRALRSQERSEFERRVEVLVHKVDALTSKSEEQWRCYADAMARSAASLEDLQFNDASMKKRMTDIEGDSERIHADFGTLSTNLSTYQRQTQEMIGRRAEELSKAVRDEVVGRENHIHRFAKELETSWQIFESRLHRGREEASQGISILSERLRVAENRCDEIQKDVEEHVKRENLASSGNTDNMSKNIDILEMSLRSNDAVLQMTSSKVEALLKRLESVESDCQSKINADYWTPHVESMERISNKLEAKLSNLEKDIATQATEAVTSRDNLKKEVQEILKITLQKLGTGAKSPVSNALDNGSGSPVRVLKTVGQTVQRGAGVTRMQSPTRVVMPMNYSTMPRMGASVTTTAAAPPGVLSSPMNCHVTSVATNFGS